MIVTLGRRVASPGDLEQPGDYSGPFPVLEVPGLEPTGTEALWVLTGTGLARLVSPPWEFAEQPDGTLEIAERSGKPAADLGTR